MPTRKPAVKKKAAIVIPEPPRQQPVRGTERRTASERRVTIPHEELNAVEQAVNDAQTALERAYSRLKKWYRS